jgi:hypothetical protein
MQTCATHAGGRPREQSQRSRVDISLRDPSPWFRKQSGMTVPGEPPSLGPFLLGSSRLRGTNLLGQRRFSASGPYPHNDLRSGRKPVPMLAQVAVPARAAGAAFYAFTQCRYPTCSPSQRSSLPTRAGSTSGTPSMTNARRAVASSIINRTRAVCAWRVHGIKIPCAVTGHFRA